MTTARIVAICMVRNEERFIDRVLRNISGFCDQILVADNGSSDSTWDRIGARARADARISCRRIEHSRESHQMIQEYVNTPTWIFGVDGDEIYDPQGLLKFRSELLSGVYDRFWRVYGNVLNCVRLDESAKQADGYLSPPGRSIVKLFNFNAITCWDGVEVERLHSGRLIFKPGYSESTQAKLHETRGWEDSSFRCLHLCFLPRSRVDRRGRNGLVTRWNLSDRYYSGPWVRFLSAVLTPWSISRPSEWKMSRYRRGPLVTKDVRAFLPDGAE